MTKVIPTNIHGVLDYSMGFLLMAAPFLFQFSNQNVETILPMVMGISVIVYSLCTDYELSFFKFIPIRMHMRLDFLGGLLLAASPWLFHFNNYVYMPHVFFGVTEMAVAVLTQTQPQTHHHARRTHHKHAMSR
jgi:hypothetical protein